MEERIRNREKINEEYLISVIVPLFNNERFISKCIDSLLEQTYANFEIIIVDDGSTDNSLNIAREYESKDARIKCLTCQRKTGVSGARNEGIENSKGDYLCFIDSDDYVSKYYIESMITAIKHTGADIAAVGHMNVSEKQNKKFKGVFNPRDYRVRVYDRLSAMEQVFCGRILRMNVWNKMYPRSFFEGENAVTYLEDIKHCEDVCFLYDTVVRSEKVVFVKQACHAYTRRKGSLVHSHISPKKLTSLNALKYATLKCEKEFPEAFVHVAGWQALVNIEMLFCMFQDSYFDYAVFKDISETFKRYMKFVPKGRRHFVYRRLLAPLGAWLLKTCYKIKFAKKIKEERRKKIQSEEQELLVE